MKFKQTNEICSPLEISQLINVELSNVIELAKGFYESKKLLDCSMYREEAKTEDRKHFFKALAMVQQSYSWPTFYQAEFMKR